jgi:hypothetical protein
MSVVPVPRPSSHQIRQRKPLEPVSLLRVECRAGVEDVILGRAVLVIVTGDATDSDTRCYWVKADVGRHGHIVSWEITKFGAAEAYHLPADCSSCDCPDHTYAEERPGGCRHMVAMRQVVVQLGRTVASSDDDPAWSERWTIAG